MKINGNYSDLWKAIIRPPKEEYDIQDLGPKEFKIGRRQFFRQDIELNNKQGSKLHCSHFQPVNEERVSDKLPCVIYMHGNCSSRLEALPVAAILLPQDITVFCFDFSGCGKSEGDWVTLGFKEKDDLQSVIDYLRNTDKVGLLGLWGRSMGAVTSIFHASGDTTIAGMALDSPFSNLNRLSLELAKTYSKIPAIVAKIAQKFIRRSILSRTGMDIEKLNPIQFVTQCYIPALFIVAKGDDFVRPHHGEEMHAIYAGDKNLIKVEGDHNSIRPYFMMDSVAIFFHNVLQCDKLPRFDEQMLKKDESQHLFSLDKVLEDQNMYLEKQKALINVNYQEDEDDQLKKALIESLEVQQEQQHREKVVDKFLLQMEHWREKENFTEILEGEMKNIEDFFTNQERECIKGLALQRRNSITDLRKVQSSSREAFGEKDMNANNYDN